MFTLFVPNESKAPEEYVSDALDLMVKARWVKQYGQCQGTQSGLDRPWKTGNGRPWSAWFGPNAVRNAIGYAEFRSRSHDAVIRVYDEAENVIETHEHAGDFKEP
jgi:hypothetical protein